jgi:hypothetical protein
MWTEQMYQREGACECCGNPLKQAYSERLPAWCGACNVLYNYIFQAVQFLGEEQARAAVATVLNLAVKDHVSKTKRQLVITERADLSLQPPKSMDRFASYNVLHERVHNCTVVTGKYQHNLRYLPASDAVGPVVRLVLTAKLDGAVSTIEFGRQVDGRCTLDVHTGTLRFSLQVLYQYHVVVTYVPVTVEAP